MEQLPEKKKRGRPKKVPSSDDLDGTTTSEVLNPVKGVAKAHYRGAGGDGSEYLPEGCGTGSIYAYVRRSAEDRSQRPLSTQIAVIKKYASDLFPRSEGVTKFFGDNGVSGSTSADVRDGLRNLFKELESAAGDPKRMSKEGIHVLVYDASRLARNTAVGTNIKDRIDRVGGVLHLANNRMAVINSTEELFFSLNLQMAATERATGISRIRTAMKNKEDWDPRKSYGWKFEGPGEKPVEIPEEQAILSEIKKMYEVDGMSVKNITTALQTTHGKRRCRLKGKEDEVVDWAPSDVSFLARKHSWVWGGGTTLEDLEKIASAAAKAGKSADEVFVETRGTLYNGVNVNRATIRRLMGGDELPVWKRRAFNTVIGLIKNERFSNDDIVDILNESHPRPLKNGESVMWSRQVGWSFIQEAKRQTQRSLEMTALQHQPHHHHHHHHQTHHHR